MAITVTTNINATSITTNSAISGGTVAGTDEGGFIPLVDILMKSKFQFAQISRQTLAGAIKEGGLLKPFQLFTDREQAGKQFLLQSYRLSLLEDTYDVELLEYDNTSEVILIG